MKYPVWKVETKLVRPWIVSCLIGESEKKSWAGKWGSECRGSCHSVTIHISNMRWDCSHDSIDIVYEWTNGGWEKGTRVALPFSAAYVNIDSSIVESQIGTLSYSPRCHASQFKLQCSVQFITGATWNADTERHTRCLPSHQGFSRWLSV